MSRDSKGRKRRGGVQALFKRKGGKDSSSVAGDDVDLFKRRSRDFSEVHSVQGLRTTSHQGLSRAALKKKDKEDEDAEAAVRDLRQASVHILGRIGDAPAVEHLRTHSQTGMARGKGADTGGDSAGVGHRAT